MAEDIDRQSVFVASGCGFGPCYFEGCRETAVGSKLPNRVGLACRKHTHFVGTLNTYILGAQAEGKLCGGYAARHSAAQLSLPCSSWEGFAFDRLQPAVGSSLFLQRLRKPDGKQLNVAGKTRSVRSRIWAIGARLKIEGRTTHSASNEKLNQRIKSPSEGQKAYHTAVFKRRLDNRTKSH